MDLRQEQDPHPMDFDAEQEIALYSLQQQVRSRAMRPYDADKYMRRCLGAFYYDDFTEEREGALYVDGEPW